MWAGLGLHYSIEMLRTQALLLGTDGAEIEVSVAFAGLTLEVEMGG